MSKKYVYYMAFLILLFLAESSASKVFSENRQFLPHLLLLYVIIFASYHGLAQSLWIGVLAGFLLELFSGLFFGAYMASFLVIGLGVYFVTRNLTAQEISFPAAILLAAAGTVLLHFLLFVFHNLAALVNIAAPLSLGYFFSAGIIATILANLVFIYPVQFVFRVLNRE